MFFLVLSSLTWVAVSLNEYVEREVAIPMQVTNVPNTVAFDSSADDSLHVTIRDKGFYFLYYYTSGLLPIAIDFNSYSKQGGVLYVTNAELRRLIRLQLTDTGTISVVKPERLELGFDQCITKVLPVRLSGTITPAGDYYLAQTIIEPAKVVAYMNRTVADSVKFVTTENLIKANFTDTLDFEAQLRPIKGVKFATNTVHVRLLTDILTEDEVEVPVTSVNVPEGASLRFFPSRVKVKFVAGVSMMKSINPDDFVLQADYKQIVPGSDKCVITIIQKPHGVWKATPEIREVDYLVEY